MAAKQVGNVLEARVKVVMVVPTWDRGELLQRCVDTAKTHARIDDVVLVDRVFPTAKARNQGVAQVPDDALVFSVDDDCWYDGLINLDAAVDLASRPGVGVVGTTRLMRGKPPLDQSKRRAHRTPLVWIGAGMLFRKRVWSQIGGYPDDYLDDVMLSAVMYRHGFENYRTSQCYGHHEVDTRHGGMAKVLDLHGLAGVNRCEPSRFLVTGEPCRSKGGRIPNIKNIRPTTELRTRHHEARSHVVSF